MYYNLQVVDIRLQSENDFIVYQDDVIVGHINNHYYDNYTKHTNKIYYDYHNIILMVFIIL